MEDHKYDCITHACAPGDVTATRLMQRVDSPTASRQYVIKLTRASPAEVADFQERQVEVGPACSPCPFLAGLGRVSRVG